MEKKDLKRAIVNTEAMDVFYMVFVEGGCNPTKKYDSLGEAAAEACRLAEKEQTNAFVLQAVTGYGFRYYVADLLKNEKDVESKED